MPGLRIPPSVVSPDESGIFQLILLTGFTPSSARAFADRNPTATANNNPKTIDLNDKCFICISPYEIFYWKLRRGFCSFSANRLLIFSIHGYLNFLSCRQEKIDYVTKLACNLSETNKIIINLQIEKLLIYYNIRIYLAYFMYICKSSIEPKMNFFEV
jgi:hypothetical protein